MKKASVSRLVAVGLIMIALPALLLASHSWGGYHWARSQNPFTLQLGNNMSADWQTYLYKASQDWNSPKSFGWNDPPVLQTSVVTGQSGRNCKMVAGTTQVCNAKYGYNGWLGLATISITGGEHITKGSAKMNDSYFQSSTYNNPNEKQHVVCQEIAHTFGLDHQSTDGSSLNTCMDYFSNTGTNAGSTLSTTPNTHDFEELAIIYAHTDSTTTVASLAAVSSKSETTDDPRSWGRLVSQSANGRSSIYERINSDGSRDITHVYWTIEAAEKCPSCDHRE